ncbi:hypothetical protein BST11_15375 [Mycobacterium alsense]|uniref:Terminase n=1 Tax=Mycobacterium alsense TaxID=324058 RepID=A0AA42BZ58_9MYCO|nr:terminase [Mycobacterium alsense]MCV7379961.1 terminase [Mycobacterium alsense]OQZ89953.1 hypothetical protein BST11_15375 [Mycobacterium alsense]
MVITPRGLKAGGRRLWAAVTGDFDLDQSAAAVLAEACYTVDELADLRAKLAVIEPVIESNQGPRMHPLFAEVRARRLLLAKLIRDVGLPKELPDDDPDGDGSEDGTDAS